MLVFVKALRISLLPNGVGFSKELHFEHLANVSQIYMMSAFCNIMKKDTFFTSFYLLKIQRIHILH